jgi:isoleucyl-tRNA synthetase
MLRWMAPFLSFTAEEAWTVLGVAGKTPAGTKESIFMDTYWNLDAWLGAVGSTARSNRELLVKWTRIREIRDVVNKDIEILRADGKVGSSLQSKVALTVGADDHALLASLGNDLKFVFITSEVALTAGDALLTLVSTSDAVKCERCWHYRDDVGHDATHPTLCGRCTSNLFGTGEVRGFA